MTRETKARLAYLLPGFLGVFLLGLATPWLKSFGSTVYVSASLVYLAVLWVLLNWLAHRVRTGAP